MIGVIVGLFTIDAKRFARLGLALVWPFGPLAFVVTIANHLLSLPIAFPITGSIVLAGIVAGFVLIYRAC